MARLLRLSMCSSEEQQNGEANVLLLHGPKNVGKTLTQHVVHFGQGGLDLCHNLLLSGGNQTTSGTSTIQIMECAKKCNFVMQLNDVTNSKLLGESLLQIHEKLQQGSLKRGLNSPMVIGILMSANTKEPTRLKGRVMRVEYHRSHQSMADEEKLVELKAICSRYKGFLTSWVIHHGELWLAMHHHVVPNVSCILQQWTIVLSYDAFLGHVRFAHALEAGFGAGLVVNGSLTKADLSDYLVFLKEDQLANNANKLFRVANHTGYMGDNYWFLSKEIQIQGGALLPANEVKYLTKPGHQLSNSFLVISEELFDKSICLEINGRILHLSKSFNQNQANLLLAMSFTMARLLRLSMCSSEEQQNGEANVLLLHGPKNVGKTLTQHVVHFGQGGLDLCHNLLLSGGNQTTSGTSTIQIMECAKKCNFVMQLNDVTNSKLLGESLLQIHEKLQQGSLKRGLNSPMVIGILMSANTKEPTRTIVLSYDAFLGHVRFAHALEAGFGAGLVVNGSLTKADLSDYLVFLKEDQLANNANKLFRVANHTGYMGDNYWFLSKEIQIQGGALLPANEVKYLTKPGHQLSNSFLVISEELFDKSICLEINGSSEEQQNGSFEFKFYYKFFEFPILVHNDGERTQGEANVLLLHGPKNVGKTLTQHVVHFGQGGLDLCHNLLLSGGNQTTSGTSTIQIMECAKKCNFVMQLNDVTNSKLLGESLLQIHEKLQQGSLKRGLNSPMVIGILMSANTKEPTRLKGRVMRVEYHRSHQSMADEEKLVELKAICTRYKGFLTSWVIHHGELWLAMHHHVVPNVSCILQQCLPRKQKRWCNGMAVVLCTHALYLVTLKEDGMLAHHLLNVIQSQDEESMEEKTLVEKLEENVIRKIQANETHIFTWLNWHFKVQCLSTKTRVCAIAIKSGIVTEEFTDISSHELHTYLEDQVKNGWSVSVTFARDSDGCTPIELSQRANNTTSTRAHKIPIRVFSKDMEKWLEFGLNGGEKPEENRKTTFEQLSDEQMAQIEKIDDTIKQKFQEMNENPNATADNDTDDLLDAELLKALQTFIDCKGRISSTTLSVFQERFPVLYALIISFHGMMPPNELIPVLTMMIKKAENPFLENREVQFNLVVTTKKITVILCFRTGQQSRELGTEACMQWIKTRTRRVV
eukprot:gene10383-11464_t